MADTKPLDDDTREFIRNQLESLDKAEADICAARKPYDDAIRYVEETREGLLDRYGLILAFKCISCCALVFEGEQGFHYADEGSLCADCAPTWGELAKELEEQVDPDDEDSTQNLEAFRANLKAHVEAGGSADDKYLVPA